MIRPKTARPRRKGIAFFIFLFLVLGLLRMSTRFF